MRNIRSAKTRPEIVLRRALHDSGLYFRGSNSSLPGKPDLVLRDQKVAIFVDGDFWHGFQWARRGHPSLDDQLKASQNAAYWTRKIRRNMQRDCAVADALIQKGWRVLRFWESDIQQNPQACINRSWKQLTVYMASHRSSPRKPAPNSLLASA
jgi:DNA mismatch endonuclease (patch repair protein)